MKMHLRQRPPALKERMPEGNFSEALEAMVRKGLAKEPADCFRDARDYLSALKALTGETLSNEELKIPSRESTANQPHIAQVPPGRPGAIARGATAPVRHPPFARRRRFSPVLVGGILVVVVALLVLVAKLEGGKGGTQSGSAGGDEIGGRDSGSETSPDDPDSEKEPDKKPDKEPDPPKVVEPMRDAQLALATDAWRSAGLEVVDFDKDLDDEQANGACRYGLVDKVRALVCTVEGDPVRSGKAMRRKAPDAKAPIKWRSRLRRGDLHLRVENVGKKQKKTRRRIETVFKKLKK